MPNYIYICAHMLIYGKNIFEWEVKISLEYISTQQPNCVERKKERTGCWSNIC